MSKEQISRPDQTTLVLAAHLGAETVASATFDESGSIAGAGRAAAHARGTPEAMPALSAGFVQAGAGASMAGLKQSRTLARKKRR